MKIPLKHITTDITSDQELINGLALKYDLSNPSGFETPSQLIARDTNNRNRSNHTGTQLADTISDFAATARSVLLSGLSTTTSAAITAADNFLVAFGKLQAQMNAMLFGREAEDFEKITAFNTTLSTDQVAASWTTASKPIGRYRVALKVNFTTNTQAQSVRLKLFIDSTQIGRTMQVELKDSTDDITATLWGYINFASVSTHSIQLRVSIDGGNTLTVNASASEIWRVS